MLLCSLVLFKIFVFIVGIFLRGKTRNVDALLLKVFVEVGSDYLINKLIKSGLTRNIQGCCLKQYSLPKMIQLA
jgi:hypothetical protein